MAEQEKILELVELAKATGKIKKGTNEATKAIEKGQAKAVIVAKDVSPPEITMHMPIIAKEKGIPFFEVSSKEELGSAAGIPVSTAAIAIINLGEGKELLKQLSKKE